MCDDSKKLLQNKEPCQAVTGGCFCGAVRYRVARPPLYSMLCYCRSCQHVSGAPAVAWVSVPQREFLITTGAPKMIKSSSRVQRQFCGDCGTMISYRTTVEPQWIDITTISLDIPDRVPPTYSAYPKHRLPWMEELNKLPEYS